MYLFAVLLVGLGQCCSLLLLSGQTIQVGKEDATMHTLFAESFATLGRLDNVTLVMVFHPQYLESFLKTQHYLLQMDGPLPLHYRHYIGIMVRTQPQPCPTAAVLCFAVSSWKGKSRVGLLVSASQMVSEDRHFMFIDLVGL